MKKIIPGRAGDISPPAIVPVGVLPGCQCHQYISAGIESAVIIILTEPRENLPVNDVSTRYVRNGPLKAVTRGNEYLAC